jgi:hypothetical protein
LNIVFKVAVHLLKATFSVVSSMEIKLECPFNVGIESDAGIYPRGES